MKRTVLGKNWLHQNGDLGYYDWFIEWLDLDPASLSEPTFMQAFEQWKQKVLLFDADEKKLQEG